MNFLYKKTIFLLYSILVFFTPIISFSFHNDSYEFVKINFFYIVTSIIILIFVINNFLNNNLIYKATIFKNSIYFKVLFGYLFFIVVSSLFSQNYNYTIFGSPYSYSNSLISQIYLISILFISLQTFEKKDYLKLFFVTFFSFILVLFFGYYQILIGYFRVSSTLGHSNWLAQYLLFFIPLILSLVIKSNRVQLTTFCGILLVLSSYLLLKTISLSGIIALIFSIFTLFYYYKKESISYNFKKIFLIILFFTLIFFSNFSIYSTRILDIFYDYKFYSSNNVEYITNENRLSDSSLIRVSLIKSGLNIILSDYKNLLFGIGLENTYSYISEHINNNFNYTSEWDFIITNVHNYYLQLIIEVGLFGFIFYVLFLYLILKESPVIFKPILISFYVTNFFGWPVISSNILFWLLSSYILKNKYENN